MRRTGRMDRFPAERNLWLFLVLALMIAQTPAVSGGEKGSRPALISITTRLDKTAVLVGDTLHYTIFALHDPSVEFALDNLRKNEFSLAPFVVTSVLLEQGDWVANKKLLTIDLLLVSYEIGKTELTIPSFSLFYFRKEAGKREAVAAESIKVPAAKVGLRSTLVGSQLQLRDVKPVADVDFNRIVAAGVGGMVGIAIVALWGAGRSWKGLRRKKPGTKVPSPRMRERLVRDDVARISAVRGEGPDDAIRFYTDVSAFLRQHLGRQLDVELAGLTPEEIEISLERAHLERTRIERILAILDRCDTVRYGKEALPLSRDEQAQTLAEMEKVVRSP